MLLGQSRSLYPSGVPIRPSLCFSSRVTAFVQKTSALPKMASVDASTKANAKLQNCKILSHEPLKADEAKWTKLVKINYQDPIGRQKNWEAAERTTRTDAPIDGVGVIALLQPPPSAKSPAASPPEGPLIVLQKQFRPPVGKVCIEIPAGLLDPKESAATCAVRELKEETGYEGAAVEGGVRGWHGMSAAVGESKGDGSISEVLFNDPGFTNTNLAFVHAAVDPERPANRPGAQNPELEENEFIHTFTVPLSKLWEECRRLEADEGCAIDARVGALAEGVELAKAFKLS